MLERLAPVAASDRFDLIVATNVLLYYNAFEQALAMANINAMLRPGGVFLSNYRVAPDPAPMFKQPLDAAGNGDTIYTWPR